MIRSNNIYIKVLFVLACLFAWGGNTWAQRVKPTVVPSITSANENKRSTWCYIHFVNGNGGYVYCTGNGNNLAFSGSKREENDNLWALIGTEENFVLRNRNGLYAKWDGTKYVGTSNASEATPCTYTTNTNGNTYWNLHRLSASNTTNWNPQTQIKEYAGDGDGGSRMEFAVVEKREWDVITNPDSHTLQYSPAPDAEGWAVGTHWYTIRNARSNNYLAACTGYMDATGYLKTRGSGAIADDADLWCFVKDGNNKVTIYNKAAGTDKVLGSMTNRGSNDVRTKLYGKDETVANISKLYTFGQNNTGYYVLIEGLTNGYWDDNAQSGYLASWQSTQAATSDGGRFFFTEVKPDGYKLIVNGGEGYTVTYNSVEYHNGDILPLTIDTQSLKDLTAFRINCTDKFVYGPVVDKVEKTVTYTVKDMVTSLNDFTTGFYQLQLFDNDNQKVNSVNNRINGSTGNINTKSNAIYVMPFKDVQTGGDQNLAKYSGVPEYANEASTFFYIERNGSNLQIQSVNGHYAVNDGRERPNATRTPSPVTSGYAFPNGHLQLTGWVIQGLWNSNGCTGNEGPRVAYNGGTNYEMYNAAKADMSLYSVYKVVIENAANASDIANDPNVTIVGGSAADDNNCGLSKVYRNGYLFFNAGYTPTAADFTLTGTSYNDNFMITIGEEINGIRTVTFSPAGVAMRVIITGAGRTDEVITYENHKRFSSAQASLLNDGVSNTARNGEYFHFKPGTTQGQLLDCDFSSYSPTRTNGTSFVYGPVIDWENRTITCEIREAITALPETGWYQLKWDVSTNNVAPDNRYSQPREDSNTTPLRDANRFYLTLAREGNGNRSEILNYSTHPSMENAPLTFIKLVRNGDNVQMMSVDGRYIDEAGNASSGDVGFNSAAVYVNSGEMYFPNWFPFAGLNNIMGKASNTRNYYYVTRADFDEEKYDFYEVYVYYEGSPSSPTHKSLTYRGSAQNYAMPTVYSRGYFVFPKNTVLTESDFQINSGIPNSITIDAANHIIKVEMTLPVITHRQSHLFDKLDNASDSQLPGNGYIKRGEGMTTNPFTNDPIQYISNYNITQYIKHGVGKQLFMPTIDGNSSEVTAYQRWYDYEHETLPRTDVVNIPGLNGSAGVYQNGYVVGSNNSRGSIIKNATANLPNDLDEYYLAVDQSRYNDGRIEANGDLREPSLTMRVIYHLVDAKVMANQMGQCEENNEDDKWLEEHKISYPNKKLWNGSNDTKSGVDYIGLNHEFSNYWCFDGQGTLDGNLEQMVDGKLIVELDPTSTAKLTNVRILANGMAGINKVQGFERNRFIAFQYPRNAEGKYEVPENSRAVIKVYMRNAAGTKFQLARISLTFIGGAEPLLLSEVYGKNEDGTYKSLRSKEAMEETYGKAVSELTFDHSSSLPFICPNGTNNEAYAFPLDFKQSSYAYHGAPWASRGEYIFRNGGSGIGGKTFYPVDSYKDAIDNGAATPSTKLGKYFLYIDASEQPGQVMSIPIPERLCVGSKMFCYGWFNSATQISQQSVGIVINIVGKVNEDDETGEIIYSYNPGLLSTWAFDSDNRAVGTIKNSAPWRQVGFSFTIDAAYAGHFAAYEMQVMNNCYSTDGGDYTLDNFYIYVTPPKGNVDFTTPLCSDALRHVKVHTDYDMLIESSGINTETATQIPVTFCFLNKEVYDNATKDYYDVDEDGNRTLKEDVDYDDLAVKTVFNTAFANALIGERSTSKGVKGHGIHNFVVPVDYESIPVYAFNDSPDDYIFKEEKDNGERRVVFKEQLYQSSGDAHQWVPGKEYYLLFAPYHVTDEHLVKHDIGTEVFHIADQCCVLTRFSIMPPIEVKGDATVKSSDQVEACDNQIITFKVDMPAKKLNNDNTDVTDAVISGLNYDWWVGTSKEDATHAGFLAAKYGTYKTIEDGRRYNHQDVNDYPDDASVKMDVYLSHALENVRFYFPEARTLDDITVMDYDIVNSYGVTQEHIDCIRHFMQQDENGRKPLSLFGQTFNLRVSHAETDGNEMQHFVAIPIIPEQRYAVDEKLIYCPAPQELMIHVGPAAPNMQNGFEQMNYPSHIVNVPIRIGKQQVDAVRKDASVNTIGYTLNIPLRKIVVTNASSTKLIAKDHETERFGSIFLTATDDPYYSFDTNGGEFRMQRVAQVIDIMAPKTGEAYMKITFTNDFVIHEGCTYTLKLPYVEDEECLCEGTLVFDMKVVPEFQIWNPKDNSSEWTSDENWSRADRSELYADNETMGSASDNITPITSEEAYADNTSNGTSNAFVPMYFTNVIVGENTVVPELYGGITPATETEFLGGLKATATTDIVYNLDVAPVESANLLNRVYSCNYTCEPFSTYRITGLNFQPGGRMLNAQNLNYKKAWVEYQLELNRWYTLSSPLQDTFAGEWYAPTGTSAADAALQITPYFYEINYNEDDCDRFRPAIYQRSWDSEANFNTVWMKDGSDCNAHITSDWSYVYNEVRKKYGTGGFSVKISDNYMNPKPAQESALIRMPKSDNIYTYYDIDGETGDAGSHALPTVENRYRLWTDKLAENSSFQQTISNESATNNYFLVGNPFMTNLDMDKFFEMNPQLEKSYWILTDNNQTISVRAAYDNKSDNTAPADERWTMAQPDGDFAADAAVVAPLQGFFVRTTATTNTTDIRYTADMQTVKQPVLKPLRAPQYRPELDGEHDGDDDPQENVQTVYQVNGVRIPTALHNSDYTRGRVVIVNGKKVIIGR